jgi:hypothetical protein
LQSLHVWDVFRCFGSNKALSSKAKLAICLQPLGQKYGSLAFKQNLSDAKNCLTASFEFEASNLHAVPVAVKMSAALRFGFERALLHAV